MANETEIPNGINVSGSKIINLGTPTASGDAVPKSYADSIIGSGFAYVKVVKTLADLPTPSDGFYTLLASTQYWIDAPSLNIGTNYLLFAEGTSLRSNSSLSCTLIYTGTGGACRGTDVNASISFIAISGARAFDFTNTARTKTFAVQNVAVANQTSGSKITGFSTSLLNLVSFLSCVNSLVFTDNAIIVLNNLKFDATNTGTLLLVNTQTYTEINITSCRFVVQTGVTGVNVTSTSISSGAITDCIFSGTAVVSSRLVGVNGNTTNWDITFGSNTGISGLLFTDIDVISTADATFPNTAGTVTEATTTRAYVPTIAIYDPLATNMQGKIMAEITSVEATIQVGLRNINTLVNLGGLQTAVVTGTLGSAESDYVAITPNRLYTAYYVKTSNTGGNVATRFGIKIRIKTF